MYTVPSAYFASDMQTAPSGMDTKEGELVLDLDVSKNVNPSEHNTTTTADSEKALLVRAG